MLEDVRSEVAKVSLEFHPGKTKIQYNSIGYGSRVRNVKIAEMDIELREPTATTIYFGRAQSLIDIHDTELRHRLAKAWA